MFGPNAKALVSLLLLVVFAVDLAAKPRTPRPRMPEGQSAEYRFDRPEVAGLQPLPLGAVNLQWVESFSGYALRMAGSRPSLLALPQSKPSGDAMLSPEEGTIRFWVAPEWDSEQGPGTDVCLLTIGAWSDRVSQGWWSLVVSADGKTVALLALAETGAEAVLKAPID